jgi:hypothetical protein
MKRGPKPVPEKDRIVQMLEDGQFATLTEASQIAGVSRQRILQWAEAAGIDWRAHRKRYLEQLWLVSLRRQRIIAKGKSPRRRSKASMRALGERERAKFIAKKNARL